MMTMVELKPIRTKKEHKDALAEIETLWDAAGDNASGRSPEADRLEVLALLVEAYEREHMPVHDPDPVEFLEYVMDSRGLARKDLEPYIGPRGRVSDVLNRVRPLTLGMIRRLSQGLKIPADVLVQDYPLRKRAA